MEEETGIRSPVIDRKVKNGVPNPDTPAELQAIEIAEAACTRLKNKLAEAQELTQEERMRRR